MEHKSVRPDYETHVVPYLSEIPEWYKTMTIQQIATKLGISKSTLYKYAKEYPELSAALAGAKVCLVDDIKGALRRRALGYYYEETTVKETDGENGRKVVTTTTRKHVPADPASIHLLLKNLDPTWHNDDMATLEFKRRELELKQKKVDAETW